MNLLTIDDITAMVQMRREYVRDKLVKRPDFPRPAFALSQKSKRWSSEDIRRWLERQHSANQR
jgi:predicted DNA-binding transcriptional regulator AlpA